MYIATNDSAACHGIIQILPGVLRRHMMNISLDEAEEIRIIKGKPVMLHYCDGDYYITAKSVLSQSPQNAVIADGKCIDELLERASKSSLYSVGEEIKNGYITVDGGHRIGITGTAVCDGGQVSFIRDISAMNIRLAGEVIGAADSVMEHIRSGGLKNTLIISPPGAGKTTLLRDIARSLSYSGYNVAVADERCELAAMHRGISPFDLGARTSVLDNCRKSDSMKLLLRSMSPDVIITDEIGSKQDFAVIGDVINSGVCVIASAHARNIKQARKQRHMDTRLFDLIITLSKRNGVGTVEGIESNA